MQQQLFQTVEKSKEQGLVISGTGKKLLTKNQAAFNKLTQKIEKLNRDMEKKELQFDTALRMYGTEFHSLESRVTEHRRQMITILWDVYQGKILSKTDQRPLRAILKSQLKELFAQMQGEPDEDLKKMFAVLEGMSYESMVQRDKEIMKSGMQEMFDEMEVDMNLDGVDLDDELAVEEKLAEVQQKLREKLEKEQEQFQHHKQKKKKTGKQLENERIQVAAEELKQKNISTIFKQLAKLFHPDLEHDETRRAEKEVLMKELTSAYEARNLHTLLTLELKWIHKESDHLESLSEEKLAIYLQILREQARDLEHGIFSLFQQPRYQVLIQEFGNAVVKYPVETVKEHLEELKEIVVSLKRDLGYFQSPHSLRHIKGMINEWKVMQRQNNSIESEFMRMMF